MISGDTNSVYMTIYGSALYYEPALLVSTILPWIPLCLCGEAGILIGVSRTIQVYTLYARVPTRQSVNN